jgi:ATP-dependent RNA helicase DDX3X
MEHQFNGSGETSQPGIPGAVGSEAPAPDSVIATQGFDGSAQVYQWNDEYGDIGPEIPELELELFGDPATRHERTGLDFSLYVTRFLSSSHH